MPERRASDVLRVEERVVRALGLLPPEEPAVLGGREGLAQRRAKGVHVGELARRGGRKAHEVLGPRGAAGSESDHAARDMADARDRVYNHRVSRFGEPYRSDY